MARSHHQLAERIGRDVEDPLRSFQSRSDVGNMNTISANLSSMAKSLEESQREAEKLEKKGGKASTQKVDSVTSRLESNRQQWESQAPYIFESLQAMDESRINQLRDLLTQYFTHEADCAQQTQDSSAAALAQVLEVSSETEILAFTNKITQGRSRIPPPTRSSTRRSSHAETQHSAARPSTGDANSEAAQPSFQPTPMESQPSEPPTPSLNEPKQEPAKPESKLRRLGTMLGGRRRQSMLGAPGASPQKSGGSTFGRLSGKDKGVSPRGSSSNLHESNRLGALPEAPPLPRTPEHGDTISKPSYEGPNGQAGNENIMDSPVPAGVNGTREGVTLTDEQPQNLPQTNQPQSAAPPGKDAEGFSIPAPMNDPISAAQREAAAGEEADQLFKLNIANKPIEEEDPEAKQAALSSVANSLKAGPAVRRSGTMRGRRDVRNTMYVPSPTTTEGGDSGILGVTGSPSFPTSSSRPTAVAALQSETSVAGTSDTQSVRSGNSLGSLALVKHPEMTGPGLNASIVEQVSVTYEGGELKSAAINGELAFVNNASDDNAFKSESDQQISSSALLTRPDNETIRINNFPNLDKIGPNRIFVQNVADHPDQFNLDLSHIGKTHTAFSYRVFVPEADPLALGRNAPMLLSPAWKPQGDKLGLLVQYQLNPASSFTGPLTLKDVVFIATYDGKSAGCQTKPSGTHLKDRHIVYWRLGDVTLTPEPQKLVCRIMGADGTAPAPGHVEARWSYTLPDTTVAGSGISISRLEEDKGKGKAVDEDDPFADEDSAVQSGDKWVDVPMARKLVSGRYEGR